MNEPLLMAIEIGGTKLQVAVGTHQGEIRNRWRFEVEKESGGLGIRERLSAVVPGIVGQYRVECVGVGFGGPVDVVEGRIRCSHQIAGWADFPIRDWVANLASVPCVVDNDANVAALGEALGGSGRGMNPVSYVTLGSGVGGGLVVDGRIYHGASPGESEIGHLRLDRSGTIVESRCSGWAVDRRIRSAVVGGASGWLADRCRGESRGEARYLKEGVDRGDGLAQEVLREVGEDLGFALSHVTHLAHPQVIVLGGGLSLVGEPLRAAVAEALPRFVMEAFHPAPEIRIAGLGEDSVPVGALFLAAESLSK